MFQPQTVSCLRSYSWKDLGPDLVAGVVVGFVALPLAMAFAIASGVPPERGLFTAIVAGFIISALGGSRVQVGGPTGAFVVIVYGIVSKHGVDGLALATCMAGVMLLIMGLSRLGAAVKFIPYPVTTGFTAGIAAVIFSSQVNDLLGLHIEKLPPEFVSKWHEYFLRISQVHWATVAMSTLCLAILVLWPRLTRRVPAPIVALVAATLLNVAISPGVETIGSRFGGIPRMLPAPRLPPFDLARAHELLGPATRAPVRAGVDPGSGVVSHGRTACLPIAPARAAVRRGRADHDLLAHRAVRPDRGRGNRPGSRRVPVHQTDGRRDQCGDGDA